MKCRIIPDKCIACGLCQVYAPSIFDYTEEGIILFKNEPQQLEINVSNTDQATLDAVIKAYRKCPVRAIEIEKKDRHLCI
ncbi:ferredoxin [Enterococcus sp. BWB1-3]|nr:ferredoxin [Enterococcus sp. BWB1-3]MBL1228601.1 ferredoxin [Enterococcus sp. BWB1-3]